VVELDPGEEAGVTGDIGDDEVGRFRVREHCDLSQSGLN
jgi:hypothetical protein